MGQIKFIGSILMAALFSIAIMSYAINFGADNNTAFNLSDDGVISDANTNLKDDIQTYKLQTNSSLKAL